MTHKYFWKDPYLTNLDTTVATVRGNVVTLSETIFYAFSGGQESDAGTIAGCPVIEARVSGMDIEYVLREGHGLKAGQEVHMEIDWGRRYSLMRLHFAAELVLEVVCREVPGIEKIGAHISADKARVDFRWDRNIASIFPEITLRAQEIVEQDANIISAFSDEAAQKRFWEVPGFARVPCGGTHLKRTGEVGGMRLKRKNIGKSKERTEVHLT